MNVGFVSLGCSKNLIDTEVTIGKFKNHDYKLYGPCRIAYADKQNIVIYDNGYYLEDYTLDEFNDATATNKNQLISISKDGNKWKPNVLNYD